MKTRKTAGMTDEESRIYDKLILAYGVQRSPAMLNLIKFLFPTREEAELGTHLEDLYLGGKAKTAAELAAETGRDLKEVEALLERIGRRIIIKWREREGQPGVLEYYNTGSRGLKNAWGHVGKDDAEGQQFRELILKVLETQGARVPKFKPRTLMIDKTVHAETRILPFEYASEIIKWKAEHNTTIALMWCNCRMYQKKCNRRVDNCIAFGPLADFYVQAARTIPGSRPVNYCSGEEALKCLEESISQGLVAQVMTNIPATEKDVDSVFNAISGICLCCSCCCEQLSRYVEFGDITRLPEYLPECDQEKCTLCEKCISICPVTARWHHWPSKADFSDEYIYLEETKCIGCGLCAYACKPQALKMVKAGERPQA